MEKIFLVLLIILFIFACSKDWTKKQAPGYQPVTSKQVR